VFAGAAAPEIRTGDQNARACRRGPIELELGIRRAIGEIAPIIEQRGTESGPLDALEELLGNDLIGVDVGAREGNGAPGIGGEGLHTLTDKYAGANGSRPTSQFKSLM
jgi:hypothetical protein